MVELLSSINKLSLVFVSEENNSSYRLETYKGSDLHFVVEKKFPLSFPVPSFLLDLAIKFYAFSKLPAAFLFSCSGILSFLSAITSLEVGKEGWVCGFFLSFRFTGKEGRRGKREDRRNGKIREESGKKESFLFHYDFSRCFLKFFFLWKINTQYLFFLKFFSFF